MNSLKIMSKKDHNEPSNVTSKQCLSRYSVGEITTVFELGVTPVVLFKYCPPLHWLWVNKFNLSFTDIKLNIFSNSYISYLMYC